MKLISFIVLLLMMEASVANAQRDDADKSLFDRNHEAIERAERAGNVGSDRPTVERQAPPDRNLINRSERDQMQRLDNDPAGRGE